MFYFDPHGIGFEMYPQKKVSHRLMLFHFRL